MLAIGLVAVTAMLDFGFRTLQSTDGPASDPWRDASLALIESRVANSNVAERAELAQALSEELGMPVQLLQADHIVGSSTDEVVSTQELYDEEGRVSLLRHVPEIGAVIRIGPIEPAPENPWLRVIPPLFYLSIFVLVALWLRPLLRDLDTITASTRAFAADYREAQPIAASVTALNELAENFDAMSGRLSALIQGQKELTSALSHEMRTPLARIRFALAVIGENASDSDKEDLAALAEDVQEIDRLVATMLNYARLDHPDAQMQWQETPAEPWLKATIDKSRLPDTDIQLTVANNASNVPMDARLMTLALSNLLVNACRHAKGRVDVSLTRNGACYCLQVDDDGEGIPEADRDRVFKAFTRLDGSRNRDTGGYGLGLAIVARIAGLHGGTASAGQSATLGGARLTIAWPSRSA